MVKFRGNKTQNQYFKSYCLLAPVPFGVILSARDLAIAKSKIFNGRASFRSTITKLMVSDGYPSRSDVGRCECLHEARFVQLSCPSHTTFCYERKRVKCSAHAMDYKVIKWWWKIFGMGELCELRWDYILCFYSILLRVRLWAKD